MPTSRRSRSTSPESSSVEEMQDRTEGASRSASSSAEASRSLGGEGVGYGDAENSKASGNSSSSEASSSGTSAASASTSAREAAGSSSRESEGSTTTPAPEFDPNVNFDMSKAAVESSPEPLAPGKLSEGEVQDLRSTIAAAAVRDGQGNAVGTGSGITVTSHENLQAAVDLVASKVESEASRHIANDISATVSEPSAEAKQAVRELAQGFTQQLFDAKDEAKTASAQQGLVDVHNSNAAGGRIVDLMVAGAEANSSETAEASYVYLQKMKEFKGNAFEPQAGGGKLSELVATSLNNMRDNLPDASPVLKASAALEQAEAALAPEKGLLERTAQAIENGALDKGVRAIQDGAWDKGVKAIQDGVFSSEPDKMEVAANRLESAARGLSRSLGEAGEPAAKELAALADALRTGNESAGRAQLGQAQAALDTVAEAMVEVGQKATNEAVREANNPELYQAAMGKVHDLVAEREEIGASTGKLTQAMAGLAEGADKAATPVEQLQNMLGDAAKDLSPQQVEDAMGKGTAERVQELGVTSEDVKAAKEELQEAARAEGRDPASVDEAVAVEALVRREDELERQAEAGSEQTREAGSESSRDTMEDGEQRRLEEDRGGAEAEAEMEMSAGGD